MKKANNLSKFDKKALRLLFAVLFVPLFVSLVFVYELSVYDSSRELPADAQKIGSSDYYNIGGKIYIYALGTSPLTSWRAARTRRAFARLIPADTPIQTSVWTLVAYFAALARCRGWIPLARKISALATTATGA